MQDFAKFIDADDIAGLLGRLIRSKSLNPPGDVRDCAALIASELRRRNLPAEIIEEKPNVANVVSSLRGRGEGKTLLWNGHFDVVLPGEDWTFDPFSGECRDGYVLGRGACDMKSGIAAMIVALDALQRAGTPFRGKIVFQAVGDEETGSDGGTRLLIRKKVGAGADFAIVSEPTNNDVAIGNRGLRWLELTVKGRASHAGRPYIGANAIHGAARIIEALQGLKFKARHPLFEIPEPSLSVTMIQGGSKVNIIPERCTLMIDRRMMPGETAEEVYQEIAGVLERSKPDGMTGELRITHEGWDPYAIDPATPWVQTLCRAVAEVRGQMPKIKGKAGGTDASHLYHIAHTPAVCFGPGLEDLAHKADERVALEKVVQAARVYALSAVYLLDGLTTS